MLLILEFGDIWMKINRIVRLVFSVYFESEVYIASHWSIKLNSCAIYYFQHKIYVNNWVATVDTLQIGFRFLLCHFFKTFILISVTKFFWPIIVAKEVLTLITDNQRHEISDNVLHIFLIRCLNCPTFPHTKQEQVGKNNMKLRVLDT